MRQLSLCIISVSFLQPLSGPALNSAILPVREAIRLLSSSDYRHFHGPSSFQTKCFSMTLVQQGTNLFMILLLGSLEPGRRTLIYCSTCRHWHDMCGHVHIQHVAQIARLGYNTGKVDRPILDGRPASLDERGNKMACAIHLALGG